MFVLDGRPVAKCDESIEVVWLQQGWTNSEAWIEEGHWEFLLQADRWSVQQVGTCMCNHCYNIVTGNGEIYERVRNMWKDYRVFLLVRLQVQLNSLVIINLTFSYAIYNLLLRRHDYDINWCQHLCKNVFLSVESAWLSLQVLNADTPCPKKPFFVSMWPKINKAGAVNYSVI